MIKKNLYTVAELDFLEDQVANFIAFLQGRPVHLLQDRVAMKTTKTGGSMPTVIATIEDQMKANTHVMKELLNMMPVLEALRKESIESIQGKGTAAISPRMQRLLGTN